MAAKRGSRNESSTSFSPAQWARAGEILTTFEDLPEFVEEAYNSGDEDIIAEVLQELHTQVLAESKDEGCDDEEEEDPEADPEEDDSEDDEEYD